MVSIEVGTVRDDAGLCVTTVLGPRDGPLGTAWATALFGDGVVPLEWDAGPALQPPTLVHLLANQPGASGAALAGVASGVTDALAAGSIPRGEVHELVLLVRVWVPPRPTQEATEDLARRATGAAIEAGRRHEPSAADLLADHRPPPTDRTGDDS
jgi:5,6,7,8-tetrahydromethanopterin hydro-lyase